MPTKSVRALLTGVVAVLLVSGCGSGTAAVRAGEGTGPSGAGSASTAPSTPPSSAAAAPSTAPKALAASVPVRLQIPSIGVDTSVMRLGLAADGSVQVPPIEANAPAGWYRNSPTPGQVGPSVILAHVTVGQYGNGVFLHLSRLRPGDRVVARLQDGASAAFTVYKVQTVAKAEFPTAAVYGNVDRPELRLITCGGPRDSTGHGYLDNVVVYAALTAEQ
ncbi:MULTISPECIES: class F sortase [Streptacidiphilus]|uniref:Class F sortase n=1 Tax=Streptacidiphilus cavernicola TaxID=3342716 RepID=A0ABV6UH50_9ACTN|nr:class F sortase [Streptacidiphilus jeojiense]